MTESPIPLSAPNDPALVGSWRSELAGTDPEGLVPIEPRFLWEITLRSDGTADLRNLSPEWDSLGAEGEPPFPPSWETSAGGMLTIYIPIAPMPEYEIMHWIQEASRYDVVEVAEDRLILSDRTYDGESITVLRRIS